MAGAGQTRWSVWRQQEAGEERWAPARGRGPAGFPAAHTLPRAWGGEGGGGGEAGCGSRGRGARRGRGAPSAGRGGFARPGGALAGADLPRPGSGISGFARDPRADPPFPDLGCRNLEKKMLNIPHSGLILLKIDKNEKFLLLALRSLNRRIFLSPHWGERARSKVHAYSQRDHTERAFPERPLRPGHTPSVVRPLPQSLLIGLLLFTLPKWRMRFRKMFKVTGLTTVLAGRLPPACSFHLHIPGHGGLRVQRRSQQTK